MYALIFPWLFHYFFHAFAFILNLHNLEFTTASLNTMCMRTREDQRVHTRMKGGREGRELQRRRKLEEGKEVLLEVRTLMWPLEIDHPQEWS